MSKYWQNLLIFCFLLFNSVIASAQPDNLPPDIAAILKRGTLIVAMYDKDKPPFCMHDSQGNLTGYDISIARSIAKALGVKLILLRDAKTYDDLIEEIADGRADMAISLLSVTASRALKVSFTKPYLSIPIILAYNRVQASQAKMDDPIKQSLQKPDIKIGVLAKSSYELYAREVYPHAQIILYNNSTQALQDVKEGKIFGYYTNKTDVQYWLKVHPGDNIYVNYGNVEHEYDPGSIAIPWKNEHLLQWVNWYLSIIEHNGEKEKLQKKYLDYIA